MMIVLHRKHTYVPARPLRRIALLYFNVTLTYPDPHSIKLKIKITYSLICNEWKRIGNILVCIHCIDSQIRRYWWQKELFECYVCFSCYWSSLSFRRKPVSYAVAVAFYYKCVRVILKQNKPALQTNVRVCVTGEECVNCAVLTQE
jgi:hypothetical protein